MDVPEKRQVGRPKTGETPKRNIRVGKIWDDAEAIAHAHGETMTVVVKRLLENYVRRHRRDVPQPRQPVSGAPFGRAPHVVAEALGALRGPAVGMVALPAHLDWSGSPIYDLSKPLRLATMYKTVLIEAVTVDDLNAWLDSDTLRRVWPSLRLPIAVRQAWEAQFPELAQTVNNDS